MKTDVIALDALQTLSSRACSVGGAPRKASPPPGQAQTRSTCMLCVHCPKCAENRSGSVSCELCRACHACSLRGSCGSAGACGGGTDRE